MGSIWVRSSSWGFIKDTGSVFEVSRGRPSGAVVLFSGTATKKPFPSQARSWVI